MTWTLSKERSRWLFLGILALAIFFRVYALASESLWVDETYTLKTARKDLVGVLTNVDMHPPLYYTMMHFWIKVAGTTEAGLRSLSLIFGVLAVWMIYRLGRVALDRASALCASGLMAFSSFHVMYSQEARSYSFLVFLGAAAFYFFIRLWKKPNFGVIAGYLAASLGLLYTHNFGALILIAQNLYVFSLWLFRPKGEKPPLVRWIVLQGLLFILFVPWIIQSIGYSKTVGKNFWIAPPTPKVFLNTFREYCGGFKLLLVAALAFLAALPSLGAATKTERRSLWLLIFWLGCTLAVPYLISVLWTPIYYVRYTIISSVPFYLLLGYAMTRLKPRVLVWPVLALTAGLSVAGILMYYAEQKKEDWRAVAQYLDASTRQNDALIFHLSGHEVYEYYSSKADTVHKSLFPIRGGTAIVAEETKQVTRDNLEQLPAMIGNASRVWLVLSHSRDKEDLLGSYFKASGFREAKSKVFAPQGVTPDPTGDSRVIGLRLYEK